MALLGEGINAGLMIQDYSGFARAGQTTALGIESAISGLKQGFDEREKAQKDAKDLLKASQVQIDAAINLFPDQAQYLSKIGAELKNEDTPLSQRAEIGKQTADYIAMAVGQKRYETDQDWKAKDLDLRRRDQTIQENESKLNQQIAELSVQGKKADLANDKMDAETKATIGPALLDSVLAMAPGGIKKDISDKIASGEYTDAEKFSLANSITALIPKAKRASAPTVIDVAVPGGKQQMQWDETFEKYVPVQVAGVGADIPLPPPDDPNSLLDGQVLPPKPGTEADVILPGGVVDRAPVGFTPTPPVSQAEKFAAEDHAASVEAKKVEAAKATAATSRTLATINKYLNPDGTPNELLKDAVGSGETVGTFFGKRGMFGNSPETIANQKELILDMIEGSILEASKALKPVSNDEMQMLKGNRPEITDPPEVWAAFMKKVGKVLSDPSNYKPGQLPTADAAPVTPAQSKNSQIRAAYGK